jgi:hypothetical protein
MKATRSTAVALLIGGLLASGAAGCGPIEATAVINDAEVALAGARAARGYDHAPYEYTTAELYLEKAREERGYAHFGVAIRYARKAAQSAREAQTQSLQKVREGRDAALPAEGR